MYPHRCTIRIILSTIIVAGAASISAAATGDFDANGFIDQRDYQFFSVCFWISGPGAEPFFDECVEPFDAEADRDVDLADFAAFQRVQGHLPMPLRDYLGNVITVDSTAPYSGRHTCGSTGCHDSYRVTDGSWFQDGRTDANNNFDMKDDYNDDGRFWIKSAGRYGKWGQSFQYLLAAKNNTHPSQIDQTTYNWVRDCSGCHPGGGPGEFDRDGQLLWDATTGRFGYELLGRSPVDVALDGDYAMQNYATGEVTLAPWDETGVSGPDCLFCHRADRPQVDGTYMSLPWRRSVQLAGANLVDEEGQRVPAFSAAGTAGQGWFSTLQLANTAAFDSFAGTANPADAAFLDAMRHAQWGFDATSAAAATILQIDYSVGVANGSLIQDLRTRELSIAPASVARPKDLACWSCHPFGTVSGTTWFDERDVMYRFINKLHDKDTSNDIPPEQSRACTYCHPNVSLDHNIAKGNSPQLQYRNEHDWRNLRHCRSCHMADSPTRHPDAPEVPGNLEVHLAGRMMEVLSCQVCHIPYALTPAVLFRDITVPGSVGTTQRYYSNDPLRPQAEDDDSRWHPGFIFKEDADGVERLFPVNIWITFYFGDWNRNGTPQDLTDDVISPIYTWRVAQVVGGSPLPCATDDDGDGRIEINRPEEILAYLEVLKGVDANGRQVAANPVLVRGKRVFYEDPEAPGGVNSFEHEGTGIAMDKWYPYIWSLDHNVLAKEESWGYDPEDPEEGCRDCHRPETFDSPVFDRLILVDPLDENGQVVYQTVREMTGLNPP